MKRIYSSFSGLMVMAALLLTGTPAGAAAPANLDLARQLNQAFADVAERVAPSVVVINVVQKESAPAVEDEEDNGSFDSMPPGFWRRFHEQFRKQPPEETMGQGSGVIVRENGYILTNRHVVEDAEHIEVRLRDGRVFKAVLRGADPQSDVAVIKIDAQGLPVAKLGSSSAMRVGEFAIAIGAPYSLDYTVTFGHVSAKGRSNIIDGNEGAAMDQDFIQTDALINPGNSGGPLVNIDGEVIGINTLIRGLHTGIGFAVPSDLAKEVGDALIEHGKFTRAWLGIGIQSLHDSPELQQLIRGVDQGVVVSSILPKGPAWKSELKPTDVITSVDGSRVSTVQELRAAIRHKAVGQPVQLEVFRKGKTMRVNVTPGEWVQPAPALAKAKNTAPNVDATRLGVTVKPLTPELLKQFDVADPTEGVIVTTVEKNSLADRKGLKPGDIITSIDQQPISTPRHFREALKQADLKKGILVTLVSNNTARFEILKQGAP